MDSRSAGRFRWLVDAPAAALDGYERIEWRWLVDGWISVLRTAGMRRASLRNPAEDWFDWLSDVDRSRSSTSHALAQASSRCARLRHCPL
jgi:hypothetical protein